MLKQILFLINPVKKDDIPLMLRKLTISNDVIERQEFIIFLGVLLDENLNWKEHIKCTENEIAKNLRLLYWVRSFLNRNSLLALYYSYIQTKLALKKLKINKNMRYVLFLIKPNSRRQ